jgi:ABC-type amino acid transport system permease subunit
MMIGILSTLSDKTQRVEIIRRTPLLIQMFHFFSAESD